MVLNGKAELAARAAKATKCRFEHLELCGMLVVLSLAVVLSYQLYLSMVDGWQELPQQRWHVLLLSLSLLLLSVTTCVYLCRRLEPTVRLSSYPNGKNLRVRRLQLITEVEEVGNRGQPLECYLSELAISRTLTSVNSQLYLITGERPPSYESVTKSDLIYVPPPPYNAVFNV